MLLCGIMFFIINMSVFAQSKTVTLNERQVPIQAVLTKIEKQTSYLFVYDKQQIDVTRKVTLKADNEPVSQVLNSLFAGTGISFSFNGKNIVLVLKDGNTRQEQQPLKTVEGKITDSSGEPLVGVTIEENGTKNGVISDMDGRFSIKVRPDAKLNVSYIGMSSETVSVRGKSYLEITMAEDSKLLDEVVVVGYGTQRKVNLTGAINVVEGEDLEGRSAANMSQLLEGAVPNMNITISSGRPGESGSLNIRGTNSISGATSPLVLIDGVEGNMDTVNPNDVASISVLKDASAAAVYGARGAFGVVLITTKSGWNGKPKVSYSGRYSFGKPIASTDFETRGYYAAAITDIFTSSYTGNNYTQYDDEDYYQLYIRRNDVTEHPDRPWTVIKNGQYKYYGNFDWYNFLFDDSRPTWEHNVSVTGGNKMLQYRLSGGYYDQTGAINVGNGDSFKRYNFRSKIDAQITDWLKISNNTSFFKSSYEYMGNGTSSLFSNVRVHLLPSIVPYNPDGTFVYRAPGVSGTYIPGNGEPSLLLNNKNTNFDDDYTLSTTFEAVLTPIKHLTITANYSYSQRQLTNASRSATVPYSQTPGVVEYRTDVQNQLMEKVNREWYQAANAFANYENTFAGAHHLSVTGGLNYETRLYKNLRVLRDGLISDVLSDFDLAKGDRYELSGGKYRYALFGLFYRVNYDWKNRYLFEASGRYDGSSRFARGHRYGFFPSFSAGWRVNEEPFFEPLRDYVSNLKVRLSYGKLGNQQTIGYYDYLQTISTSNINYAFGESTKANSATISSPNASDFTWEKVTTKNLGFDLGFFNNRLNASADFYIRDTKGILMASKDLPSVYGASSPNSNAASIQVRGYELAISWNDQFQLLGSPFRYSISAGLGDYTGEVTEYNNDDKRLGTPYKGQKLGELWGYVIDGFFATDEEAAAYTSKVDCSLLGDRIETSTGEPGWRAGDVRIVDMDGNGKIESTQSADDIKDQVVIGNELPRYTYNFRLSAEWKGVDVSAFFQGVGRQHWYPGAETALFWGPYQRPYQSFLSPDFLSQVWSESNPDAYFPRPRAYVASFGALAAVNNRYLQNVRYCRLKNLTIGYTLPDKWLRAIRLEKVRVYFSGENLFTWSPITTDYVDPVVAGATGRWNAYQRAGDAVNGYAGGAWRDVYDYTTNKTFSFGLDVTF